MSTRFSPASGVTISFLAGVLLWPILLAGYSRIGEQVTGHYVFEHMLVLALRRKGVSA